MPGRDADESDVAGEFIQGLRAAIIHDDAELGRQAADGAGSSFDVVRKGDGIDQATHAVILGRPMAPTQETLAGRGTFSSRDAWVTPKHNAPVEDG